MTRQRAALVIAAVVVPLLASFATPVAHARPTGSGRGDLQLSADQLTPAARVDAHKARTSRLARSDPRLLRRTDDTRVPVVIKFDYDSTATYAGGVGKLAATSPSVTGRPLTGQTSAERAYDAHLDQVERGLKADIRRAVPSVSFGRSLRIVYGGVAAVLPASRAKDVAAIDGVVAVQSDALRQPLTDSSARFVNAPPVYDELGGTANAGEGVIYGNLDTGIWPEHPSFADKGNLPAPPGPARECNYGNNPLTPEVDVFVCQHKLIGGAAMTDTYDGLPDVTPDPYAGTARDGDGHGTHTSSTSAGNIVNHAVVLGVDRGRIHGMAPGAWVMEYKVCGPDGCFTSDSAAAVGQAIVDGVDVINFSISGGTTPFSDPGELAFLDAYAAGIFVSASAGNEGPGAGTVNHLSPWTTSVAASTQAREFASTLSLTAANGDTFTARGASITDGAGPAPVMLAEDVPDYAGGAGCGKEAKAGDFVVHGRPVIVACQRGGQARVWKGFVAFTGGAAGMILYNPVLADTETDNHWLPVVHLADGTRFRAFMGAHGHVQGSFTQGEPRQGEGDVMAAFSSRGPGGRFLKPDLTAPGVQILAGASPTPPEPDRVAGGSPPGQLFQAIAGTSMSSPHVAGAAILDRAVHPDWTPGQIRSALMTTAITDVVKQDTVTPADPFDIGAGRIDVGTSIYAPLLFDETATNFLQAGNDPLAAVHLNLPSINAPVVPGRLETVRTATNASGRLERVRVLTDAPVGSAITVSPHTFDLRPGESVDLHIRIKSDAPIGVQQFGTIRLETRRAHLHLPVAFIHTQGEVNLVQSCSPQTVQKNGRTECTVEAANMSFETQDVELDSTVPESVEVRAVDGATRVNPQRVHLEATLDGAQPGVPSVGPEGFGYLELADFGLTPDPIGDEEILNYGTSAFEFAGRSWDTIGVDSNGYILVGGGSSEDNQCCDLPDGPDPERPNNILAPFWTDLDGSNSPGVFAVVLEDQDTHDEWLVVEYKVHVFGSDDQRAFQVWLGLNGVEDIVYEYAEDQTAPGSQEFLVGAENELGEGDMEAVLPTTDGLMVTSTGAVPGDVASYAFTARGVKVGTGDVVTEMTASRVPGVTVVRTPVRVIHG